MQMGLYLYNIIFLLRIFVLFSGTNISTFLNQDTVTKEVKWQQIFSLDLWKINKNILCSTEEKS